MKFSYNPSPFNIIAGLLILAGLYYLIKPGPMGYGAIMIFYFIPTALLVLLVDLIGQYLVKNHTLLFVIELGIIVFLTFWLMFQ